MNASPFGEYVMDILWFDGPLTVLYQKDVDLFVIIDWEDDDENNNYWREFFITKKGKTLFLYNNITFRELLTKHSAIPNFNKISIRHDLKINSSVEVNINEYLTEHPEYGNFKYTKDNGASSI